MDANERRLVCTEALCFYHSAKLEEAINDGDKSARDNLNRVAKTYLKIAKLLTKKKIKLTTTAPKVYTKKEFKVVLKGTPQVEDDESEDTEEEAVEEDDSEDED